MKMLKIALSIIMFLSCFSLSHTATLEQVITDIKTTNPVLSKRKIRTIRAHLETNYPSLEIIPANELEEALCRTACDTYFFVPYLYLTQPCLVCSELPISKRNLKCCGKVLCKGCLLTICTDNLISKGTVTTTPCPFCRAKFMTPPLNRFLRKKKKYFYRAKRKARSKFKGAQQEQLAADFSTADEMYHADLMEATAGDAAYAAALAAALNTEFAAAAEEEEEEEEEEANLTALFASDSESEA